MSGSSKPDRFTLSRWSRRKLESARDRTEPAPPTADNSPRPGAPAAAVVAEAPAVPVQLAPPELPPVESLTIDSDFAAFLKPEVDESMRRKALRKLFSDPQFNVMDGLDVYIDDYTKTTPIPDDVLQKLAHARYIFNPPKTRLNEQGFVEDVPEEEAPQAAAGGSVEGDAATADAAMADVRGGAGAADEGRAEPALVAADGMQAVTTPDSTELAPAQDSMPPQPVAPKPVEPAR